VLIKEVRYRDDLPVQFIISMASPLVFVNMMYTNYFYIETYGQKPNEQIKNLSLHDPIKNGSPFLGNVSAPITIIDFSDFQCYLCNRFVKNTEPLINETYIQTGKVASVFGHS
jgi:protein-disulfide isomerase